MSVNTSSPAPNMPGRVLHVPETVSYVGLSRAKIYELIKAGHFAKMTRLSARRVGFRVCDLDAWLEGRAQA